MTIVRPRTILGHGRLGIFGILFDWIADGADPFVLGDGSNRYQFVHADDLADGVPARRRPRRAGDRSTPAPTASARCARRSSALCAPRRHRRQVRSLPGPADGAGDAGQRRRSRLAPFAPYHWLMYAQSMWFDIDHVRDALGWQPRCSNDEMFAQSYDWFLAHRDDRRRRLARTTAARPGPAPSARSSA